ncbi:MAG: hypothetical protein ACK5YW_11565 [Betaproteobacteria bacterium]|jgi:hypothetical protein
MPSAPRPRPSQCAGLSLSRASLAELVRGEARSGRDPAFGRGRLGAIIQDTLSLRNYFAVASLLLF